MYKIGDKLWVTSPDRRSYTFGGKEGRECMVTKVGRKWVYFTMKIGNTAIGRAYRFSMKSGYINGGKYASPGRVWLSREAYEQSIQQDKAWQCFKELVNKRHTLPDADYLAELAAKLTEIINHAETPT